MTLAEAEKITPQTGAGGIEDGHSASSRMLADTFLYWEDSPQDEADLPFDWLDKAKDMVHQLLSEHRERFEAVVATFEHSDLVIRVLNTNTEFLEPFERAKARLEIRMTQELSRHFDDVVVQSIPVWGITEQEKSAIMREAVHLI